MRDLSLLVRSRHPIIFIRSHEAERLHKLLMHLADSLGMPFYAWTRSKGLKHHFELAVANHAQRGHSLEPMTVLESPNRATLSPLAALEDVEKENRPALYYFQGLGTDLNESMIASKLRDAARQFLKHEGSIVISGSVPEDLPDPLHGLSTVLDMPLPSLKEYRNLAESIYRDLSRRMPIEFRLSREEFDQLSRNLQGLSLLEAEKILTKAMIENQQLGPEDVTGVRTAKKRLIEQNGLLEFYASEHKLDEIAGLQGLKNWLSKRRAIVQRPDEARQFGLEFPKGILLLGVQGSGKSLCAKAVASDWQLPLIKMDPSSLFNKYIGETERNFRQATALAEKLSPIILWIDEIEKAFAAGSEDGGVSQRILGVFLAWLQERKGDVFVVATANDVSKLAPELLRKGRFDELFFVDLPNHETRKAILALHLRKRKRAPAQFDLESLARSSEGFSGAELEQAIVSGLYTAFAEGEDLTTELLEQELRLTVPLSVTMAEKLAALRNWAKARAVPAN